MSLGNTNQGNNKPKYFDPVIDSNYKAATDNGIDPSILYYSYYMSNLAVNIAPMLSNPSQDRKWDHDNKSSVYLTHRKARIFREEIQDVLDGKVRVGGVNSGAEGLITFSDGSDVGSKFYCLVIRKLAQDGTVQSAYVHEFNKNYHYGIQNFDAKDPSKYDKKYYDLVEIYELIDQLEAYYINATNAVAASVRKQLVYEFTPVNNKMHDIMDKLGIQRANGGGNRGSSRSSFFNNSDSTPPSGQAPKERSLDDL